MVDLVRLTGQILWVIPIEPAGNLRVNITKSAQTAA
jgi:hypothetical protein